jgi:hypothetical protein
MNNKNTVEAQKILQHNSADLLSVNEILKTAQLKN